MAFPFPPLHAAGSPDLIRAAQKDSIITQMLQTHMSDSASALFGNRSAARFGREIGMLSGVMYYGLTTLHQRLTVGEEYCDLIQTHAEKAPSLIRRLLFVVLHVVAPYFLRRSMSYLLHLSASDSDETQVSEATRSKLERWVPRVEAFVTFGLRCHLALFYLTGVFYEPARRISGLRYVFTRQLESARAPYAVLGILLVMQLICDAMSGVKACFDRSSPQHTLDEGSIVASEENKGGKNCVLCLEPRKHDTATQCGHIFCWNCLVEWCNEKAECPLCRQRISTSRFIKLQHYVQG